MSQHDMVLDNADGAAIRGDINAAFLALATNSSGVSEPPVKYPFMWWPDVSNDMMKQRNANNTGWIDVFRLSTGLPTLLSSGSILGGIAAGTTKIGRSIAQLKTFQTGAIASGVTQIPWDSSIPQSNEGDQFMSLAFTPTGSLSTLEIDVEGHFSPSAGTTVTMALFQDSTANALAASQATMPSMGGMVSISIKHIMVAGATGATTFKVRAGGASPLTLTFNGSGSTQIFSGVMASRITIKEWLP